MIVPAAVTVGMTRSWLETPTTSLVNTALEDECDWSETIPQGAPGPATMVVQLAGREPEPSKFSQVCGCEAHGLGVQLVEALKVSGEAHEPL